MPTVSFTSALQRFLVTPSAEVEGATLADALAFGSTSGGLRISEDGGDSWTMPEARLPPIAAVRFAES